MKIIFYSTPAYGYISPALNIIKAYVDAGHEVLFYTTKTFEAAVLKTGAVYHEYSFDELNDAPFWAGHSTAIFFRKTGAYFFDFKEKAPVLPRLVKPCRLFSISSKNQIWL